jgi:hypothetical protein
VEFAQELNGRIFFLVRTKTKIKTLKKINLNTSLISLGKQAKTLGKLYKYIELYK